MKKFLKYIILVGFLGASVFIGYAYSIWLNHRNQITANLEKYKNEVATSQSKFVVNPIKIYDKNNVLIGEFHRKNFKPIRTDNLAQHHNLIWALLSSEDRDFYKHSGINYAAVIRAVVVNLRHFKLSQGGSTITQQLAKLSLDLGERNIFNKMVEVFCTYYIERNFDKQMILAMYMNQIFLGEGNTGLEQASRYYFNKSANSLSSVEAALLIGVIPAPSVYNPVKNLHISLERQRRILFDMSKHVDLMPRKDMIEKDFPSKIEENIRKFKNQYKIKQVADSNDKKQRYISMIGQYGHDKDFRINEAPDFNDSIRKEIIERFKDNLDKMDLKVYTTLDLQKQKIAISALREGVEIVQSNLEKRKNDFSKKKNDKEVKRESEIIAGMNGGFISMNPNTGFIEALVGAYKQSNIYRLNRAEDAKRQPGSAIKGLVYVLAIQEKIITPSTIVVDEKININGYSPRNWYNSYKGNMTARQALALSVNTISVKLLQEIGVNKFIKKLGEILSLSDEELKNRFGKDLSLALGTGELSPLELSIVYATIANGGKKVVPRRILKITNKDKIEYSYTPNPNENVQLLDPIACAITVNLLESVLSEEGTMTVREEYFPRAGKTGTVQIPSSVSKRWGNRTGIRDSWFTGIIPGDVSTIWVGNDQGAPFPGSGSSVSGQIWSKYAVYVKKKIGLSNILIPEFQGDYFRVDICGENGMQLSDVPNCKYPLYGQYYYKGTEPKKSPLLKPEILAPPISGIDTQLLEQGTVDDSLEPVEIQNSNQKNPTNIPPIETKTTNIPIVEEPEEIPIEDDKKSDSTDDSSQLPMDKNTEVIDEVVPLEDNKSVPPSLLEKPNMSPAEPAKKLP